MERPAGGSGGKRRKPKRKGKAAERLNARKHDRIILDVHDRVTIPLPPGVTWQFEKKKKPQNKD